MHRQIGAALLQSHFQLFHKEPLAADFAQAAVQDLVALSGHAQEGHLVALLSQQSLHMLGLPQGEAALTGCNGQIHVKQPTRAGKMKPEHILAPCRLAAPKIGA